MSTSELDLEMPHKVADLTLADWGRKEIALAETILMITEVGITMQLARMELETARFRMKSDRPRDTTTNH